MTSSSVDRDFNKNFLLSLGVHGVFLAIAFYGGEFISKTFSNHKDVEVIRSAVRVDVVGMPKFTVQELKKMQANPVIEKPEPEVKGAVEATKTETEDVIKEGDLVIKEEGKKKASFLNLLNDYSSKKVTAKPSKKGAATGSAIDKKSLDSLIIEGNRISKGSALVGDYSDEQTSEFSAYVQNIPGVIRPFWKLPSYLLDKNLRCRIRIFLSDSGQLLKLEVIESSGQTEFDERAAKAVRDAAPFPRPKAEVGSRLANSGIILGFPL